MSQWWAVPMLLGGGLFVGGVAAIAWERAPAWRTSDLVDFWRGFAHTLRQVDHLRPALLVVCLGATIGFASSAGGAARTLAALAAGGLLVVLVGSVALLVPIQRRLVCLRVASAIGRRGVASQVVWRSPGAHRRRAGLLRPGRRRHHHMRTPTPTGPRTA
jgi:hypothetical protein